jgi:hypothetical protein
MRKFSERLASVRQHYPVPIIVVTALCGLAWLSANARAQPMADQLPATTLVYSGWSPNAALQDTKAARMLADERIVAPWRNLLVAYLKSLPGEVKEGGDLADHLPRLLADASQCEGCFALLEVKKGEKHHLNPQAVLILNLGAKRKDFEEHFKPIHERLKKELGDSVQMLKIDQSWLWGKNEHNRDEYFWGFVGDRFIVYYGDGGEAFLRAMVAGKPAAPLSAAPAFVDCLAKIPGDAVVVTTYADVPQLLTLARVVMQQDKDFNDLTDHWKTLLVALGLDNVRTLGEKTVIQDQQFVTRTLLRTDGAPQGLLPALLQGPVDDAMLKCVPPDAMVAFATRLDLAKTYDEFKAAAVTVGGEDAARTFSDLEQQAKTAGVSVPNVLAPLGDQWVIYNAASTGGMFLTGWTLVGTVKDAAAFNHQADTITKLFVGEAAEEAGVTRHQFDVDGVTVHYLEFGGFFELFQPAWAQAGDKLVIALYPQIVEDAVRQLKADKSLLDNPDFQAMRKRIGNDGPTAYLATQQLVTGVYPYLLWVAQAMHDFSSNAGGAARPETGVLIPSLQRLLTYVGSDGICIKSTPDGILVTKSVANPLLSPMTMLESVPLLVGAGVPGLTDTQVEVAPPPPPVVVPAPPNMPGNP